MREKSFDSINVVPFIDIMLVLLTIVLATATFISTGAINVNLPEVEKSANAFKNTNRISIEITEDGRYTLNHTECSLEAIVAELKQLNHESSVSVFADKKSQIQPFAELITILKSNGFENIDLITRSSNN